MHTTTLDFIAHCADQYMYTKKASGSFIGRIQMQEALLQRKHRSIWAQIKCNSLSQHSEEILVLEFCHSPLEQLSVPA